MHLQVGEAWEHLDSVLRTSLVGQRGLNPSKSSRLPSCGAKCPSSGTGSTFNSCPPHRTSPSPLISRRLHQSHPQGRPLRLLLWPPAVRVALTFPTTAHHTEHPRCLPSPPPTPASSRTRRAASASDPCFSVPAQRLQIHECKGTRIVKTAQSAAS